MKALEIDDTLAEAHTSLAKVRADYDWDWEGAEKEFKRAIDLNPNYATAHHWYGNYLARRRRFDEALAELNRAQELDPLSRSINSAIGALFYDMRQYDQAIEHILKSVEMDSTYAGGGLHNFLGLAYEQKGMYEEAIAEFQQAVSASRGDSEAAVNLGHAYAVSGRRREARDVLDKLKGQSEQRYISAYYIALIYAGLDERDQAVAWLQRAYEERSRELVEIEVDPRLDNLRSDPRFAQLLERLGLTARVE